MEHQQDSCIINVEINLWVYPSSFFHHPAEIHTRNFEDIRLKLAEPCIFKLFTGKTFTAKLNRNWKFTIFHWFSINVWSKILGSFHKPFFIVLRPFVPKVCLLKLLRQKRGEQTQRISGKTHTGIFIHAKLVWFLLIAVALDLLESGNYSQESVRQLCKHNNNSSV